MAQHNTTNQSIFNKNSHSLTPRELVYRHMRHPDEPITDEDMENLNLKLSSNVVAASEVTVINNEQRNTYN